MRLGILGCGALGSTWAERLIAAGHRVRIHDKDTSRREAQGRTGCEWSDSPQELLDGCNALISALPTPEALESALLGEGGLWSSTPRRTLHIETSTVGLECVRRLAAEARSRGIRYLDAPASRGADRPGDGEAIDTEVVLWVGGHADYYDLARPLLETLADNVVYCGGVGAGQTTKLVNNLIAHSLTVIVGEALAIGVKAGVPLTILQSALSRGTGQNRLLDEMLPSSLFAGNWEPGLRLDLALKDLRLAAGLAEEHGVPLTAAPSLIAQFEAAAGRGWGDLSAHAVLRLIEEAAGIELRANASALGIGHAGEHDSDSGRG